MALVRIFEMLPQLKLDLPPDKDKAISTSVIRCLREQKSIELFFLLLLSVLLFGE